MKLIQTSDGSYTIELPELQVSYHSKYGAIQESNHVFIDSAFRFKAIEKDRINIFELGLGTGLNALLTALQAERKKKKIVYCALEANPLPGHLWKKLNYTDLLKKGEEIFNHIHSSEWDTSLSLSPNFTFRKIHEKLENWKTSLQFDIVYYDAFAPNAQPELWEIEALSKMFNILKPGGIFVTYCAKGSVKRTLKKIGFQVESLPGPPGKREMTRATRPNQ